MEYVAKKSKETKTTKTRAKFTTKEIVFLGLLSGLSYVLMLLESPPYLGFLRVELSDVPAIVGAFTYGPVAGVIIELIKNLLKALTASKTAFIGEAANFMISVAYVVPAAILFRKLKGKGKIFLTFFIATISMTVIGFLINYFVTIPMYAQFMPMEVILEGAAFIPVIHDKFTLILYGISPFNIVKGILMGITGYYTYQGVKRVF